MFNFVSKIGFLMNNCIFSPLEMSRIRKFGPKIRKHNERRTCASLFFFACRLTFLDILESDVLNRCSYDSVSTVRNVAAVVLITVGVVTKHRECCQRRRHHQSHCHNHYVSIHVHAHVFALASSLRRSFVSRNSTSTRKSRTFGASRRQQKFVQRVTDV